MEQMTKHEWDRREGYMYRAILKNFYKGILKKSEPNLLSFYSKVYLYLKAFKYQAINIYVIILTRSKKCRPIIMKL